MQVTIGGDRLGSGNKQKTALRNYERSTFNLTQKFTSSLQVGTLYPFLVIPAMRGDKFTIDLEADGRTIPTKGPLFGSFKMQVDIFECPVRLYQAILHNNPLKIGLNMSQVKFPILTVRDSIGNAFSNNCLLKYLGMSGLGHRKNNIQGTTFSRGINAIPALAYYEIFKTYYSNKQEELAYTIGTEIIEGNVRDIVVMQNDTAITWDQTNDLDYGFIPMVITVDPAGQPDGWQDETKIVWLDENDDEIGEFVFSNKSLIDSGIVKKLDKYTYFITSLPYFTEYLGTTPKGWKLTATNDGTYTKKERGLEAFPLENIDQMRLKILSHNTLGYAFRIDNTDDDDGGIWDKSSGIVGYNGLPYTKLVDVFEEGTTEEGKTLNINPLNGLVIKTYQSDIYNNWINTEWIDGENGIAAITAISTASGSIKIDTINLSEKLYNMLNRIAVSDGSYEGWQDAVYTDTPKRHIESPVYLGGMSSEIMFEEIVQTTPTEDSPLGNLGGKGKLFKRKGGHVVVKCSEACFIIGIVSLTPRINYCQGNEFYMTDIKSMDDFHKPALDGIGFQNLIAERMAWWDTAVPVGLPIERHTVGKVPAWMEYMTAVDKCYGDFAETEGRGFMTLLRDYTRTNDNTIKDATTYIDPRKYNYAFAVTNIDAQNFWVQIKSDIVARRLMSAKQIPNI